MSPRRLAIALILATLASIAACTLVMTPGMRFSVVPDLEGVPR